MVALDSISKAFNPEVDKLILPNLPWVVKLPAFFLTPVAGVMNKAGTLFQIRSPFTQNTGELPKIDKDIKFLRVSCGYFSQVVIRV